MNDPGQMLLTHRAPPDLLERSMRRAARPPSRWRAPLTSPRVAFAAAVAASFLVGLLVGGARSPGSAEGQAPALAAPAAEATANASIAVTASSTEERLTPVRLVLHHPGAAEVGVAGTWNGWDPAATPMRSAGGGVFFTIVALPPGQHEYMFVIDGKEWVADPTAPLSRDDGFGRKNAVLRI